jgi:hypothetical protein
MYNKHVNCYGTRTRVDVDMEKQKNPSKKTGGELKIMKWNDRLLIKGEVKS